jgi:predicted membrane-bound spermidine synthase
MESGDDVSATAGLTYGADLSGSCLGALAAGTFLIPVAGIPATCRIVAMINLAAAVALAVRLRLRAG